jgi:hypothetical protein
MNFSTLRLQAVLIFLSGRESPDPLRLLALFLGKVFSDFAGLSHSVLLALSMIE